MLPPDDLFSGKSVERHTRRTRFVDPDTGEEHIAVETIEVTIGADGVEEHFEDVTGTILDCKHPLTPGTTAVQCEPCSKKAGRAVYVCSETCAVIDYALGIPACVRCTTPGPDGRRYTKKGFRKARRLGLFVHASEISPTMAQRTRGSFLASLLSWW